MTPARERRSTARHPTPTVCPHCAVQCGSPQRLADHVTRSCPITRPKEQS